MARQYGKMYASTGTAGLGYVWITSQQRTAYRMIARHYLGNWYALGRRDGARRYTAIVEHDYRAGYDVCVMGSTAAEMQERVHRYIDTVIASWQIDEYARVYPTAEMPTELHQ